MLKLYKHDCLKKLLNAQMYATHSFTAQLGTIF